jgi:hypothetical protein
MKGYPHSAFHFWSFLFALLALPFSCFAGGSVDWERVSKEINKDDKFLAAYIAQNFDIATSGGAQRVGYDQSGNSTVPRLEIGTRLPPYDFNAKPKGSLGDFTLHITMEPISSDNGKTTTWQVTIRKKRDSE